MRAARGAATAARYFLNAVMLARRQKGWGAAATAVGLLADEARKLPRLIQLHRQGRVGRDAEAPVVVIPQLLSQLRERHIEVVRVTLDRDEFARHLDAFDYPRFYAGGSVISGGFREAKLLEYFASLTLLPVSPEELVIDVASERSVFPDMLKATVEAKVLRQDLSYAPGRSGDRLGGSAHELPVPSAFADKIFLHNSFEHFEGDIDTRFVAEVARVLKPGGAACIVPLYLSVRPQVITDPLLDTSDVDWDPGAEIVERIGHRNRFGRCYSVETLDERVLQPAARAGLDVRVYHFEGVDPASPDPVHRAHRGLRFGLVLSRAVGDVDAAPSGSASHRPENETDAPVRRL